MSKVTVHTYRTNIQTASGPEVIVACYEDEPVVAQGVEMPGGNVIYLWDAQDAIEIGHALLDAGLRATGRIRD